MINATLVAVIGLMLSALEGCTIPGAVTPSTMPLPEHYSQLGGREKIASCGYTILTIPLWNPKPLSALVEELVHSRGGDALIEVASDSSSVFYLVGMANCLEVRGKIVKFSK